MGKNSVLPKNGKKVESFIRLFKNYKELVAIITFFTGGVFWLHGYFATKNHVKIVNRMVNNQISMVENRIYRKILFDSFNTKLLKLSEIAGVGEKTGEQKKTCHQLQEEVNLIRKNLELANEKYENSYRIFLAQSFEK